MTDAELRQALRPWGDTTPVPLIGTAVDIPGARDIATCEACGKRFDADETRCQHGGTFCPDDADCCGLCLEERITGAWDDAAGDARREGEL